MGKLLSALGRHPYRPAHLHYIIKAEGFARLVTHVLDLDDPSIRSDAVFGVKQTLIATVRPVTGAGSIANASFAGPYFDLKYDFTLAVV